MATGTSWVGRFSGLFTKPAVPVGMGVVAVLILGLGEMQSRPIRAQL